MRDGLIIRLGDEPAAAAPATPEAEAADADSPAGRARQGPAAGAVNGGHMATIQVLCLTGTRLSISVSFESTDCRHEAGYTVSNLDLLCVYLPQINRAVRLSRLHMTCSEQTGAPPDQFDLYWPAFGMRLELQRTIDEVGLEDGDEIEMVHAQRGD